MLNGKLNRSLRFSARFLAFSALLLGAATHAQCPPAFQIAGQGHLSRLGNATAAVGDVDADGFDDFAIAAYGAVSVRGVVYVISGQTHQTIHILSHPATEYFGPITFGFSLAGVGDLNQDGHAEVLVGARDFYLGNAGQAIVYSGIDGSIMYHLRGEGNWDMFGASVSSAGDCNADGIGDFLISAPMNDFAGEDAGRVYLYSGADGTLLNTFEGAPGETLGREIDGGVDLNGDGIPDFIAGAPSGGLNYGTPGVIYAFSSQNKTPLYSFMTTSPDSTLGLGLGMALSFAGDLNNDGVSDIIAGVPGFKALFGEELYPIGSVEIRSGIDGSVISVINAPVEMDFAGGGFGKSVAGGGDVNGDGVPDIAIGSPSLVIDGVRSGAVFLYSGSDFLLIKKMSTEIDHEYFGVGLDLAGDYNQDGLADLIVGAFDNDAEGSNSGKAYLYTCMPCCDLAGDANHDYSTNIADATFLIGRIFSAGAAPYCADAADANGDNNVNIADITMLIARIFAGGAAPVCGNTGT